MADWTQFFSPPLFAPQQQMLAQNAPLNQPPYTITNGPDYEKWDEALYRHGAIRFPKELDEPQQWLNQDHFVKMLNGNGIERIDQPDGSVILRKLVPVS